MSRVCELTGSRPMSGNKVSHSNRKTRTRWLPNLKNKKVHIQELGQTVTLTLSTRAIRTIDKYGNLEGVVMKFPEEKMSETLRKIKRTLTKKRQGTNKSKTA